MDTQRMILICNGTEVYKESSLIMNRLFLNLKENRVVSFLADMPGRNIEEVCVIVTEGEPVDHKWLRSMSNHPYNSHNDPHNHPSLALAMAVQMESEQPPMGGYDSNLAGARALEYSRSALKRVAAACTNCKKDHASCDTS
ncbi:hypothetical protein PROFUN_11800 [Planoprotostelium fungivorum]|uniref:Uncharacterized protein n=1 Tax=Planoprotostelium fungivorum TaxID=1890364 RepID=A0A2P6MRH1_9EUKA|nr:hypothetical protein PROFUN_11800 [Planoprotostelium fungivorum]